jgi:hypothetical protein
MYIKDDFKYNDFVFNLTEESLLIIKIVIRLNYSGIF